MDLSSVLNTNGDAYYSVDENLFSFFDQVSSDLAEDGGDINGWLLQNQAWTASPEAPNVGLQLNGNDTTNEIQYGYERRPIEGEEPVCEDGLEAPSSQWQSLSPVVSNEDAEMVNTSHNNEATSQLHFDPHTNDYGLVCYGMIYHVDVKLVGNMSDIEAQLTPPQGAPQSHIQRLTLKNKTDHILLTFPNGMEFGILRGNMIEPLSGILDSPDLRHEAVALSIDLRNKITSAERAGDAITHVDINIYGPPSKSQEVGDKLSSHKLWLQQPDHHLKQFQYENPHHIRFPDLERTMQYESPNVETSRDGRPTQDDVMRLVSEIQGSTRRAEGLERTTGDQRLQTALLEHQGRALSFMLQRESGDIPEEFLLWKRARVQGKEMFVHRITKTRSAIQPEERGGGILADEMGMGKSLSTLALIIQTIEEGREWSQEVKDSDQAQSRIKKYTHATLIIVPSALLITSWLREINKHLHDDIKVVKYHGHNRPRGLEALSKADIVLTTYKTLATDAASKRNNPLHKIGWFRVVLDEAHNIRQPATTFHRSCCDVYARSRWCLTGTPIQNRLEDIGALFVFLKVEPFHSLAQFRRFLVVPFQDRDPIAKERLVMLYDSLVLRRTKDILHLPGQEEKVRELHLSPEERAQYNRTSNILARRIREQVGDPENSKFGMFQINLQLRIFCNHGTHQKPFSWRKHSAMDGNEALLAEFGLKAESLCVGCNQPRPIINSNNSRRGFVERCSHILCADCWEDYENFEGGNGPLRHCPLCQNGRNSILDAAGNVMMQDIDTRVGGDATEDAYFNTMGYSTKMNALVEDVKEAIAADVVEEDGSRRKTKRFASEPRVTNRRVANCDFDSIIFSCWTRTLNLIELYLRRENIEFLRIDGECPPSKRQKILDRFSGTGGPQIMLMTTGTGAFGLNLTAASRIFIIELQWNPSVEKQAIARAIRIRQTEKVIITRYMMVNTVEQQMLSQQTNKQLAAAVGFVRSDELDSEEA